MLTVGQTQNQSEQMLIFQEQIHYFGHPVSGIAIHPLANKIEALMKLKLPTNIKKLDISWPQRVLPKIHM